MGKRRPTRQPQSTASDQMAALSARVLQAVTPELLRQHEVEQVQIVHADSVLGGRAHRSTNLRLINKRLIDQLVFAKNPEKCISLNQFEAGDRFHQDHEAMNRPARVVANYTGAGVGGEPVDESARQLAARKRYELALKAIPWRDRALVRRAILEDRPLGPDPRRKNVLSPMDRFRRALDRLIKHYGIG